MLCSGLRAGARRAGQASARGPCLRLAYPVFSRSLSTSPVRRRTPIAVPTSPAPPTPATQFEPLPPRRSIPFRRALLLFSLPIPPARWPSHLETLSPLLLAAGHLKKTGVGVNAIYDGAGDADWPPLGGEEAYPARLVYPDGHVVEFPSLDMAGLKSKEFHKALEYRPDILPLMAAQADEILVCTHGSRDCRCADHGGALVSALRDTITAKNLPVKVSEVAHVGGHKWAANALLLPSLEMFSNLRPEHAPKLLDFVKLRRKNNPMWEHYRGCFGRSEEEQDAAWRRIHNRPPPEGVEEKKKGGERVKLRFRTSEGEEVEVKAPLGLSLLEVGKLFGLPSLEGTCGGNMECATCHLYVPETAPVPEPSEDELDMLEFAISPNDDSRLGCQIKVTPELGVWAAQGGVIRLPRF